MREVISRSVVEGALQLALEEEEGFGYCAREVLVPVRLEVGIL
jgi:hypothetical protein